MSETEGLKEFTFIWKIENFLSCEHKNDEYLSSPTFVAESLDTSKWKLRIYPRHSKGQRKDFVSCYLTNIDLKTEYIYLNYKIDLMGANKKILVSEMSDDWRYERGQSFGWTDMLKYEELKNDMKNCPVDTLTVLCHMKAAKNVNKAAVGCEALTKIGVDKLSFQLNIRMPTYPEWKYAKNVLLPDVSPIEFSLTSPGDDILITICRNNGHSLLPLLVTCKMNIVDVKGFKRNTTVSSHWFDSQNDTWKFPTFISKMKLKENRHLFLHNEMFVLACELKISNGEHLGEINNYIYSRLPDSDTSDEIKYFPTLQQDFRNLLNSTKHSDVKLNVDGEIFLAHKSILAARSSVFSVMFEQNMTESQSGIVEIADVDSDIFKRLLHYLYSDIMEDIDYEIALKLLLAANKYQVLLLREKCAEYLISALSEENVCEVLVIGDMVGHKQLKISAMNCIKEHSKIILPSAAWRQWVEKNVKLAIEVFAELSTDFVFLKKT